MLVKYPHALDVGKAFVKNDRQILDVLLVSTEPKRKNSLDHVFEILIFKPT